MVFSADKQFADMPPGKKSFHLNKRILSGALTLCLCLCMAACGNSVSSNPAEGSLAADGAFDHGTGTATAQNASTAANLNSSNENTTPSATVTVTDMVGRSVQVTPGNYKKVACIGAGALRLYCYVGDTALLCAVEDIDNLSLEDRPKMFDTSPRPYVMAFGENFKNLPSCGAGGPNAQAAEAEKILSCGPDIVLSEYEDAEKADALQKQLGVPVITLRTTFTGVFGQEFRQSLELLGVLFGKEDRAAELIAFADKEAAELSARTETIPEEEKPSVYLCGIGNWGTTNHRMTVETYSAFQTAHIKNAVSGLGMKGAGEIEEEKFVSLGENMDVMIIDAAAVKNIVPLYREDPAMFSACKAWKEGEVYLEMAYNAYYTNYEIALANAWFLAKTVYPEQFADVDMTAKTNEITDAFLGQELAQEIFSAPASYGGYQKIDTETFFQ